MVRDHSLAHGFMGLSLLTALALLMVQWMLPSDQPVPTATAAILTPESALTSVPKSTGVRAGVANVVTTLQALLPGVAPQSSLLVDLSDRRVYLYRKGEPTASYDIAVGREGWETPTGAFQVMHMQTDPTWQHPFTDAIVPPGAENPLGSRWIGFWSDGKHQLGLHGTNETDLIGQAVSHGCIRLHNADVEALYNQVAIGTPVIVRQ